MTSVDLLLLSPIITLSIVILVVMMVIAFARNLALTCGLSALGLLLTLASIVWVNTNMAAGNVTPLIIVDYYGLAFSGLVVSGSFFICLISYSYSAQRGEKQDEFFLLLLLATLGGLVLAHSAHFATFVLGLELLGISIYALISYPSRGLFSLEAALKYLILSGVSSAIILFGIALLYAVLGTMSFTEMATNHYQESGLDRLFILVGCGMILGGLSFKLSLAPFHMWTPDVYEGAPAPVTAFLATVSKGAIFAVLMRFFIMVDSYQYETIINGLFWLSLISIIVGNLLALMQNSIKRMLAYSSIAQMGYLMVAFIAASAIGGKQLAIEASAFFLIAYFLTTIGAFGVITIMSSGDADHDTDTLEKYEGMFWQRPLLASFFTAMLLSLAGIPLTAGFIGKFYIIAAGVGSELWTLLIAVVVGSGIGLFYYLRVIFTMTKQSTMTEIAVPITGGWALAAVTLSLLVLGVYPTPVIEWVSQMAHSIL
ncbi:MAG: NADH-quinone oxidoreductase subunit N [bacterium]|nr:NADH-quinone oxidoreductase subunit N [Gammaproteobacteria bacterium]